MIEFEDVIFEQDVVVHCPEEWMDENIREALGDIGYRWNKSSVNVKVHSNWSKYENDSCINLENNDIMRFDKFEYYKEEGFNILHYDDVVIKDETLLDYELIIKGRKAEIGSELLMSNYNDYFKVRISNISIDSNGATVRCFNMNDGCFVETSILDRFFWEKPTIHQLPDTEGNLSEVKIGQHVWVEYEGGNVYKGVIYEFNGSDIEIMFICDNGKIFVSNKERMTHSGGVVSTNKPSRFIGKQDWTQAPEKAMCWAIDKDGESYWFEGKPMPNNYMRWGSSDACCIMAGYRNDLIDDRENIEVTDWRESLVMRPKEK